MTTRLTPPQRLPTLAPRGALLKQPAPQLRRPYPRRGRERDDKHLSLIRQCPCLHCGGTIAIEAAHVQMTSAALGKRGGGIGAKRDDRWTVPLCADGHREQHAVGEPVFWGGLGINPVLVAHSLWMVAPDLEAMTAIVVKARGEPARR